MQPKKSSQTETGEARDGAPARWRAQARGGTYVAGRYRLDALIGRGGAGETFRAHDVQLARDVALKLMIRRDLDSEDDERFLQEARIGSRLRHPHIVEVFDVGVDQGLPFLVMELLEGQSLHALLRLGGPLSPERTLEIMFPILGAVAFAHDHRVLHRDLKPDNIFLAVSANGRITPQLLDFGVAKVNDGVTLTRSGTVVGTPAYMSPEQALDEALSPHSDVWSLGVTLHELLSSRRPFEADGLTSLLLKVVNTPAPSLTESAPHLPKLLAHAVDRTLRRNPSSRPGDARELARSLLGAALHEGIAVPTDPEPIGLADYETWRREFATSGSTLKTSPIAVQSAEPSAARAVSAQLPLATPRETNLARPRADHRARWIGLAVLLLTLGAGGGIASLLSARQGKEAASAPERATFHATPVFEPRAPSQDPSAPSPADPANDAGPSTQDTASQPSLSGAEGAQPRDPARLDGIASSPTRAQETTGRPPSKRARKPRPSVQGARTGAAAGDAIDFEESWR